jgi:hypothetical protein
VVDGCCFYRFLVAPEQGIGNRRKPDEDDERNSRQEEFESAPHESLPVHRPGSNTDGGRDNRN